MSHLHIWIKPVYVYLCCSFDYTGWTKKCLWIDLEKKCFRNSKIFLMESFSLYIYSHFLKKLDLLSYVDKKLLGSKNPCSKKSPYQIRETKFFVLFLFLLQNESYSCLVLKFQVYKLQIGVEVTKWSILPQKCLF